MKIAIVNLKGGAGKTATAVHLAAGLHASGEPVVLVDADPQASALGWTEAAESDWLTVGLPSKTIHQQAARLTANGEHLVIDTPPGDLGVVTSALRAADLVVIPVQPTGTDLSQFAETVQLVEDVQPMTDAKAVVLLTRVVKRTVAAEAVRDALEPFGVPVLDAVVPQSQTVAMAHGRPVRDLGAYAEVLAELRKVAAE